MPLQLSYPEQLTVAAREGQLADSYLKRAVTGVNEVEAMPFGRVVVYNASGSTDRSVVLPSAATPLPLGIGSFSHYHESFDSALVGVAQVVTLTVGGTATDGAYSFNLEGVTDAISVTRSGGSPAANADIAAALRAAGAANSQAALLYSFGGAGANIIVTKLVPGSFSWSDLTAPSPGTLVAALTTGGEADGIKQNEEFNVVRSGTLWVRPENAVTPASGVFWRHAANAGVGTALGALRGADDGANTEQMTQARWLTSAAAGGLAKLEINLD